MTVLNGAKDARELARSVLAEHAEDVDRKARFPSESVDALRAEGLLRAPAGGLAGLASLAATAEELGRGCGSTAMIWAMHQIQMACVRRHGGRSPALQDWLSAAETRGLLLASVTSERGTGGDLRTSRVAVRQAGSKGRRELVKDATTVSYGQQADAFLVTARRGPDSSSGDQVAVLLTQDQVRLTDVGTWEPLGMRGTCSPGFRLAAEFDASQILPDPFGDVAARTMVPLSHLLWSAVWIGLATEAYARATRFVRRRLTGSPDAPPDIALAEAHWRLAGVRAQLSEFVRAAAPVVDGDRPPTAGFLASANALKLAASENCLLIAGLSLRSSGMAGYAESGPFSVARILRDLHSAPLMIGNERLLATNASLGILTKGRE